MELIKPARSESFTGDRILCYYKANVYSYMKMNSRADKAVCHCFYLTNILLPQNIKLFPSSFKVFTNFTNAPMSVPTVYSNMSVKLRKARCLQILSTRRKYAILHLISMEVHYVLIIN